MALGGMAIGFAGFWFGSHPGPWLTAAVVLLMLTGLIYVFSRPYLFSNNHVSVRLTASPQPTRRTRE